MYVFSKKKMVDGGRPLLPEMLRPPFGDLGGTYDDHLRLTEKRVVDFLLVCVN